MKKEHFELNMIHIAKENKVRFAQNRDFQSNFS